MDVTPPVGTNVKIIDAGRILFGGSIGEVVAVYPSGIVEVMFPGMGPNESPYAYYPDELEIAPCN